MTYFKTLLITTYRYNRNARESPLLRLPAELRSQIYSLVIGYKTVSIIHIHSTNSFGLTCKPGYVNPRTFTRPLKCNARDMTALNGVCRQLYLETSRLPFELNIWAFRWWDEMEPYLHHQLREFQRNAIQKLVAYHGEAGRQARKLLPGLRVFIADKAAGHDRHEIRVYTLKPGSRRKRVIEFSWRLPWAQEWNLSTDVMERLLAM